MDDAARAEEANLALKDAQWAEQAGLPDRAVTAYRRVLALFPGIWEVQSNLANLLLDLRRPAEAREAAEAALALNPGDPLVNANMGRAWLALGQAEKAVPFLRAALAIRPELHPLRESLALALLDLDRREEAAAVFREVEGRFGDDFQLLEKMAKFYTRARMGVDAERCLLRLLQLNPKHEPTYGDLALLYMDYAQFTKANEMARRGLEIAPDSAVFWNTLANSQSSVGLVEDALRSYRRVMELSPGIAAAHSNLLLTMHYVSGLDPGEIFAEHQRFGARHTPPALAARDFPNRPEPRRRLRIGYVSPDIRTHSVAFFLEPLLDYRDRERFEVYCYGLVKAPDQVTQRLRGKVDQYRNVVDLQLQHIAAQIKSDELDILIDLSGHAGSTHTAMLGYKPAPVQVTYLGYPDTTGIPAVDYRLTDWLADPPGAEAFNTEQLVRLPDGFLSFRPPPDAPDAGPPPCLDRGHVTFGSFNREFKVSREVMDLWCRILTAVPGSRMYMKCIAGGDPATREFQLAQFEHRGIDRSRVELVGFIGSAAGHLAMYRNIDIALDTFPYHGTTTTLDSLLMGVPVVTLAGYNHASRVGVSLLTQAGTPELIAGSADDYVAKAVALAGDPARLAALHGSLRQQLLGSTLCDGPGFCRKYEFALRGMWLNWCRRQGAALTPAEAANAAFDFPAPGAY